VSGICLNWQVQPKAICREHLGRSSLQIKSTKQLVAASLTACGSYLKEVPQVIQRCSGVAKTRVSC